MNKRKSLIIAICVLIALVLVAVAVSIANNSPKNNQTNNSTSDGTSKPQDSEEYAGKVVCLSKKGDGPHTLECAIGLLADDGKYYVVKEDDQSRTPGRISTYPANSRVVITGTLSTASHEQYNVAGVITATDVRSE